eukprot:scaffold106734_cov63-Phaeocystis_antarctica.AAC.2
MREATRYARREAVRYARREAVRCAMRAIRHLHAHLSLAVVTHEEEPSVERDRAHLRRWWGDGKALVGRW